MSDKIPTDLETINEEIDNLLAGTPETTDRGRLMHLINAKAALSGSGGGGGGANYNTALTIGTFEAVDTPDGVDMINGKIYLDDDSMVFSSRDSAEVPVSYEYMGLLYLSDFIYYLQLELPDGSTGVLTTRGVSGCSTFDGYYIGHMQPLPFPLPPVEIGTKITVYAQPVPLGSNSDRSLGYCIASVNLIDLDISALPSSLTERNPSAQAYQAGIDSNNVGAFTAIGVKTPEGLSTKLRALDDLNGYGLTDKTSLSVEFYVGGAYHGIAFGIQSGTVEYLQAPEETYYFEISNRGARGDDLTLDPKAPINMRVFLGGATAA